MKLKLLFQASLAMAVALALIGVLRDVNPTRAIMPLPVQPFAAQATGGLSTTRLGQNINPNYTATQILTGERTAGGYGFYGPGFGVDLDKEMTPDGTTVGTVTAEIDVGCDGIPDHMYFIDTLNDIGCDDKVPLDLTEETTAVQGTPDTFLVPIMPPYPWLARHKAAIKYVCFNDSPVSSPADLNTIYTAIPFSPNGGAKAVSTVLGGQPGGPPPGICLDTPSNSQSTSTIMNTPPVEGDIDGPCNTTTNQCADAGIYGMWTSNTVSIASSGSATIPVQTHLVNNGPEDGSFKELWDVESTNADIVAVWPDVIPPGPILSETVPLLKGVDVSQIKNLSIECHVPGNFWGLVVLKNILAPRPDVSPLATEDTYLDNNAMTFTVLVKCGSPATTPEVDKQVATIRTVPDHVAIATSGTAPVAIDAVMANRAIGNVLGDEWLVAEAVDADATLGPDLTLAWTGGVTVTALGKTTQTPTTASCGAGCIKFQVNEWPGQADVNATLNITCPATTATGLYPVVVKAIDAPAAGAGFETKPSDNAQRKVITVRCGGADPDGKEDGAGLYPIWNIYKSGGPASTGKDGDIRKPFQSPPSFPSDTGYVERTVQLECYWMDSNGCATCDGSIPGQPADGVISAEESWNDPDMPAGGIGAIDSDGDCLVDPAVPFAAQPGHPVDPVDAPSGIMCDTDPNWINYREDPGLVHNDKSADSDCDGLVDGIENAWGSNPLLPDSDSDGSRDFVEMFQFINPVNPDTDGDGYRDGPVSTYGDNTNTNVDNCPSVANGGPFQLNSDGHRRDNGPNLPGLWASNPAQDKLGDACDVDNDNDNALDVYETGIGTNPLLVDTDGDTVNDGAEARRLVGGDLTADPLNAAKKPAWNNTEQVYYRGCHINVNDTTYPAFVPYLPSPSTHVEMDLDGDGVVCPTDADSDNGHANKTEILDKYEAYGYNLSITAADTDGDGCDDWVEVMDVNGDRTSDSGDQGRMNRRIAGLILPNAISDLVFDVNKDGFVDAGDQGSLNRNICSTTKNWGGCPVCGSEN